MGHEGKARAARRPAGRFERLTAWLTLAANLGVLAGLVLVILQLNQNEKMMRAQTRHEIASGIVELLTTSATSPQLAELIVRNNQGGKLTPAEQYQVQLRINALFRLWESEHYQYRMSLFDEEEFARERIAWKNALATNRGLRVQWCRTSGTYSPAFAKDMNGLLDPRECAALGQGEENDG